VQARIGDTGVGAILDHLIAARERKLTDEAELWLETLACNVNYFEDGSCSL